MLSDGIITNRWWKLALCSGVIILFFGGLSTLAKAEHYTWACRLGALCLSAPPGAQEGFCPVAVIRQRTSVGVRNRGGTITASSLPCLRSSVRHGTLTLTGRLVREPTKNISGGSSGCNFYGVCFPLAKCFWNCCWNKCLFFLIRGTHKATVADLLVSPLLSWDLTLMEPHGCTRPIPLVHTMLGRWADSVSWGDVMKCLWVNVSFKERVV